MKPTLRVITVHDKEGCIIEQNVLTSTALYEGEVYGLAKMLYGEMYVKYQRSKWVILDEDEQEVACDNL